VKDAPAEAKPLTILEWYGVLRFGGGGFFCLLLGIWLMDSPDIRQNPKVFTIADALPGLGALLAGFMLIGLAVIKVVKRN